MKFVVSQLAFFTQDREARRNVRVLLRLLALLGALVLAFSLAFHLLMEADGRRPSSSPGRTTTSTPTAPSPSAS